LTILSMAKFFCAAAVLVVASVVADPKATVTPWCDNSLRVQISPDGKPLPPQPGALQNRALVQTCGSIGEPSAVDTTNGNIAAVMGTNSITFTQVDTGKELLKATYAFGTSTTAGYVNVSLQVDAGDPNEKIFGMGQGDWNQGSTGCGTPANKQVVVPLQRNGQTINLHQRKFFVAIPFIYSTAGYGFLLNMPGYGSVTIGGVGKGGAMWTVDADVGLDFWISALPANTPSTDAAPIYSQYADATGHAPPLRDDAKIFWQSRNRYMTSKIALEVATNYSKLDLPVGVLVIDYKNQVNDGDFLPDPDCYPDIQALSDQIRQKINATTVFSFWPEVKREALEYDTLKGLGCLINPDLGGLAIDPTTSKCRDFIWENLIKPRYFDKGITAYWLDETDGEGTAGGDGTHGYDTTWPCCCCFQPVGQ